MAEISAFRGFYYNVPKVKDLSKVTTQPYDRIDDELQDEYYKRSPHNLVRIVKGKEESGDNDGKSKYTRASVTLVDWLKSGVLTEDDEPALYAVHHVYKTDDGEKTRRGFIAMVKTAEFGRGDIYPHEVTHAGPKVDRLKLYLASNAFCEHVFFLYSDPKNKVNSVLQNYTSQQPILQAVDDFGEKHLVWKITDKDALASIKRAMANQKLIIADGHHRYETTLELKKQVAQRKLKFTAPESPDYVLATLVNMDDEGLTCFATHRAVYDVDVNPENFLSKAREMFDVAEYPPSDDQKTEFLEDCRIGGFETPTIGVIMNKSETFYILTPKDISKLEKMIEGKHSSEWKRLDVNLLHSIIFEKIVGITKEDLLHEQKVHFYRSSNEVIEQVVQGKYSAGFILNPVKMKTIRDIVKNGERFPQKTTDFYPKLLSGLVMVKFRGA